MTKPTHQRHVYLKMKDRAEALDLFLSRFDPAVALETEIVATEDALDRVTAETVSAKASSPSFHCAAMDGYAVKAEETYGAHPDRPVRLEVGAQAQPVNTGQVMPAGFDGVIMIENVNEEGDRAILIEQPAYPWQHVRKVGEDVVTSELILPSNHPIGPYEIGALIAGGVYQVPVKKRPRVTIIPTGSELVTPEQARERDPEPGQIVEFNGRILAAMVRRAGGVPCLEKPVPDDYPLLRDAIKRAVSSDADAVIVNAGASAGSKDYTAMAVGELGEVLVHGVTIMPGKPTVLGVAGQKPLVGLPGYPVSAVVAFEAFVLPLLAAMLGVAPAARPTIAATPVAALPSKLGLEEFIRVKLGRVGQSVVAVPLKRGAGTITSLTRADGIVRVPVSSEGLEADQPVQAELLCCPEDVEGTIVAIGSHDNTLDLLADFIHRKDPKLYLSSGHVGSLGGLMAVKRGQAHLCGTHLLDPETGDYNFSYLDRYLPDTPLYLVNLVWREQGFIVLPQNPKNIKGVMDLIRDDVTIINRQTGAGTRILLDHSLEQAGLTARSIKGYDQIEYTHMAVAVAVLSGRADAGVGIYAAANALGLDFAPLIRERYDLVVPAEFWETDKIQTLVGIIRSDEFKRAVVKLGGYGLDQTGEVLLDPSGRR